MPGLQTMTVEELKELPEWDKVKTPRPTTKDKIIEAILGVRGKNPKPLTVACPVRGHRHTLEYVTSPDRPDLLVAYCGFRAVVQIANPEIHSKIEPDGSSYSYSVPSYDEGD